MGDILTRKIAGRHYLDANVGENRTTRVKPDDRRAIDRSCADAAGA
jgi:hypothetical protein